MIFLVKQIELNRINYLFFRGYWRQPADERFGDPPPQGGSRNLQWSEIGMEDPQEDPLAVHCFCVCSGSVLLGDPGNVTFRLSCRVILGFTCAYSLCIIA